MGRRFCDLRVFPKICGGEDNIEDFLKTAVLLKFKVLAFPILNQSSIVFSKIQKYAKAYKIDYVMRADIVSGNLRYIKRKAEFYRKKVELITVIPLNISTARLAARDSRIDIINFERFWDFLDTRQAKMMKRNEKILEVSINSVIKASIRQKTILFKKMYKALTIASRYDIPIIVSSGARNIYEMRDPRTLASFLYLFEINTLQYKVVSEIPVNLIEKNRERLENEIVRGVKMG